MLKLYEVIPDHSAPDRSIFIGPNGWKIHLALLRKNVPFEFVEVTWLQLATEITAKRGGVKATSPALELEDGTILCDSFKIAEYLEEKYPESPSLFAGTSEFLSEVDKSAAVKVGKVYSRVMDSGVNSGPQWLVWFNLIFPELQARIPDGPVRDYFISDRRLGPDGYRKLMEKATNDRSDLVARAKSGLAPFVSTLADRPGEFLQGKEPGFVDFVVFGRYAMCRNSSKELCKEIWEDQGVEIREWIQAIIKNYPSIEKHLR